VTVPTLAVVGHPNKGKSSIVATLTDNAAIAIAPEPGTTQTANAYTMTVDGVDLYRLVDTPGFERPNQTRQWLAEQNPAADQRRDAVARFVETHRNAERFAHECELLQPVLDGAGILYVVDGSVPFGPDYEAEMEILRWTGQPRMALINPIGQADFIKPWQNALRQYFDIVRVFNATDAPFDKRIALLEALAQLRDDWREPLSEATRRLRLRATDRRRESARAIANMLADMTRMTTEKLLARDTDPRRFEKQLAEKLQDKLRQREQTGRREVEAIHGHPNLDRHEPLLDKIETDLFNTAAWYLFGLSRTQLAGVSAVGGAVVGGIIDAGAGGSTFLLGSAIGAAVGGASAWLGADKLERTEVLKLPLGGRKLICGPVPARNFPYVVLGRALAHHAVVAERTHAARTPLAVESDAADEHWIDALDGKQKRALERAFTQWRKGKGDDALLDDLADTVAALIGSPD
jgi:hypothetical protein